MISSLRATKLEAAAARTERVASASFLPTRPHRINMPNVSKQGAGYCPRPDLMGQNGNFIFSFLKTAIFNGFAKGAPLAALLHLRLHRNPRRHLRDHHRHRRASVEMFALQFGPVSGRICSLGLWRVGVLVVTGRGVSVFLRRSSSTSRPVDDWLAQ